jgi:predicted LPLAT superfamily acyltransferase
LTGLEHSNSDTASSRGWLDVKEAGNMLGVGILLLAATACGRWPVRMLLRIIVLYYALFYSATRKTSGDYFRRLGLQHSLRHYYRHLLHFAECSADRLFFIRRQQRFFQIQSHGREHLKVLREKKRGAILLGAHLGSFEAMSALSAENGFTVNVVGYFRNAQMINNVLQKQGSGAHTRLIEVRLGDVGFAMELNDCIERGELVAILGDRVMDGASTVVDFIGGKAQFPVGVYALASVLRCPVYLTFGLYSAPNRYDLYCEPFAEEIHIPKRNFEAATRDYAQRYANRLEYYCRLAPYNWFNFYDFWRQG